MNDEQHPDETDTVRPDDESRINRQVVLGGVVVALTLAIAAWLAYGVVERSATSPRAAGLVPDGASAIVHGTTSTLPDRGATSTTRKAGTTTSTGRQGGTTPRSSTTAPGTTAAGSGSPGFAALWQAYSASWVSECKSIWQHSSNGKLYDPEDPGSVYTINDCTRTLDKLFVTANVTTVAKARTEGARDAASFTGQLTLSGKLCWVDPATDQVKGCWVGS